MMTPASSVAAAKVPLLLQLLVGLLVTGCGPLLPVLLVKTKPMPATA
jgi:hypothetical protein